MANKGQSLVIFILILPILLLLFALILEIGNLNITINKYETEIKDTIKYDLNHLEDENLETTLISLLKENIKGDIKVNITNGIIQIKVKQKYDALFNLSQKYNIDITYTGYIENEKIILKKE